MCGIFGACLRPNLMDRGMSKAAIAKFKMLGMYNVERGRHSCGILMDNTILKGVDKEKEFQNFIIATPLPNPNEDSENYIMIGHTRWATHGEHNINNAHPFMIDDNFVLAHNGVIRNIWALCNKYKVDHNGIKVDSHALAKLINQEGFKVLSEYEGFAALLMTRISEPNSLYVYRGESKRTANGEVEEERPLHYLQCEEGVYFSSMDTALLAISDTTTDKLKEVEPNIVHKFTNGVMTKSKYPIERGNINVYTTTTGASNENPNKGTINQRLRGNGLNTSSNRGNTTGTNSSVGASHHDSSLFNRFEKPIIPLFWYETLPSRANKYKEGRGVIYHEGRYWIVSDNTCDLAHGLYAINKKGVVRETNDSIKESNNFYFYKGIMMKDEKCYRDAMVDHEVSSIYFNFAMMISKYSNMPVANTRENLASGCKNASEYVKMKWYENRSMCVNTGFTPKFSDRNYTIKDGLLESITPQKGFEGEIMIEQAKLDRAMGVNLEDKSLLPVIITPFKQELPFKEDKGGITILRPHPDKKKDHMVEDWDVTNFYLVFTSIEQARQKLSIMELNAIRYYIVDIMKAEMSVHPSDIYEDSVDAQVNMFLQLCIDNNVNLTEMWDEKGYNDILNYLIIAMENPNGEIYDNKDGEVFVGENEMEPVGEACEFIAKPYEEMSAQEKFQADFKRVQSKFSEESIKRASDEITRIANGGLTVAHRKGSEDTENFIDFAISRDEPLDDTEIDRRVHILETDMSKVEIEETTANQELEYSFNDTIDALKAIRGFADELQSNVDSDFAQDVAYEIYTTVDPLWHKLYELSEKYSMDNLKDYMRNYEKQKQGV